MVLFHSGIKKKGSDMKKRIILSGIVILIFSLAYLSSFTVSEKEQVIITQFGRPVKIVKEPGLHFKLPGFIQTVNRFDRRTDIFKTQPIQLLLGDKNPIILTCYLAWKIGNPLTFFQSVGNSESGARKLSDMVNSQLGSILGDYSINNIINTEPRKVKLSEIEELLLRNSNERARGKYGIEIVKIGLRRIVYPSIVSESVYERMKSERRKEANKYRAEGREEAVKIKARADKEVKELLAEAYRKSEIIKGEGDSQSMRIYAEAYGKDPEFFQFLKSLETYKDILKEKSTLILSTESELFKYLNLESPSEDK
jgi:membrane protease subunit HflC